MEGEDISFWEKLTYGYFVEKNKSKSEKKKRVISGNTVSFSYSAADNPKNKEAIECLDHLSYCGNLMTCATCAEALCEEGQGHCVARYCYLTWCCIPRCLVFSLCLCLACPAMCEICSNETERK